MTGSLPILCTSVALSVAAPLGIWIGRSHETVTHTLIYEIETDDVHVSRAKLLSSVAYVIDNNRLQGAGAARLNDNDQVVVDLYGDLTPKRLDELKFLISTVGMLEFRILAAADMPSHAAVIELAKRLSEDEARVRLDDREVARWMEVDQREFGDLKQAGQRGLIVRMSGTTLQALVLVDDGLDLTGDYLSAVDLERDDKGQSSMLLTFTRPARFS